MPTPPTARFPLNWVFYGHGWIALGAAGLSWLTGFLVHPPAGNGYVPLIVFLATLGVYTLHRLLSFRRAKGAPDGDRYRLVRRHPTLSAVLGMASLLAAGGLTLWYGRWQWWPLLLAGPLTFWYLTPLWPGGRRGRDLPYVKVVWVALCWTLVTVAFPYGNAPGTALTAVFCYTLAVALLFDFRDTELDRRQGVRTVANRHPRLARGLATGSFLLSWLAFSTLAPALFPAFTLVLVASLLVVRKTGPERSEDFYAIWVNGLLVLLPTAVGLLSLL